jgi:hypothetical protein
MSWVDPLTSPALLTAPVSVSGVWRYVTNQGMADPGSGLVRSSAARDQMALSTTDKGGADHQAALAALTTGASVEAIQKSDATVQARWELTADAVDHTTWVLLTGVLLASSPGWAPSGNTDYVINAVNPDTPQPGPGPDTSFGTIDGLATKLGVTYDTPEQQAQAEQALEAARQVVRDLTGQQLTYAADDVVAMDWKGDLSLWLPELPVDGLTRVEARIGPQMDDTWQDWPTDQLQWSMRTGELRLTCNPWPPNGWATWGWPSAWMGGPGVALQGVRVTYDHGYDPVPADLVDVVYGLAGRSLASPTAGQVRQETIGAYSYQLSDMTAGPGTGWAAGLTAAEAATIQRYKVPNRA